MRNATRVSFVFPVSETFLFYCEIQLPDVSAGKSRAEQRKEIRKALAARVKFTWTNPKGSLQVSPAMLEDHSFSGASMRIRHPMAAGARVDVQWYSRSFSGIVRFCKRSGMDYILGIKKIPQLVEPKRRHAK
jgi:hypothetical protein